jgi:hypothetical protein
MAKAFPRSLQNILFKVSIKLEIDATGEKQRCQSTFNQTCDLLINGSFAIFIFRAATLLLFKFNKNGMADH